MRRQVGDLSGQATTLNNISYIYWQEGRAEEVIEIQQQIIAITQQVGDVASEALFHVNLAQVLKSLDRIDEAVRHVEQSIALLEQHRLPQDAGGGTVEQKRAFLAQLISSDPPPQQEDAPTLDQLLDLVVQARQGNSQLGQQLTTAMQALAADAGQPAEQRTLASALVRILVGDKQPDLSGLTPKNRDAVSAMLARL